MIYLSKWLWRQYAARSSHLVFHPRDKFMPFARMVKLKQHRLVAGAQSMRVWEWGRGIKARLSGNMTSLPNITFYVSF